MRYSDAIWSAFDQLLSEDDKTLVIGQGVWSPWYVGATMADLEIKYGVNRVIDTPVSEQACTGAALGVALIGYRPVVIHPRVDFALLAIDQMVNQAAKWSSMFGGGVKVPIVYRLIVNRGGEQGAQHSQSLYSWFAHIPGLRVVLPATPQDARDLLLAASRSDDPVVYMDDRWLYDIESPVEDDPIPDLADVTSKVVRPGTDVTIVGASYGTQMALQSARRLSDDGIDAEVVDLRVVNPIRIDCVIDSVARTGRLVVVDMDWRSCGIGSEILALCAESVPVSRWRASPRRVTLPDAPAPTSKPLEDAFYPTWVHVVSAVKDVLRDV
jgi:pyruvate dehydrogenase E1 component beta subunit